MSRDAPEGRTSEVFTAFLKLGLTSFGGLVAWLAFTMPSALILFAFAMGASALAGPVAEGFLHGLPAPACCRV
jgi:chromate transporter